MTVISGRSKSEERWTESAQETAGVDVDSVYHRFPHGIKIMLQWLEAARLVHRMAVQVKTDEQTRERRLKECATVAMQSGVRGRQSRLAFSALLVKARENIEARAASSVQVTPSDGR